MLGNIWEWCADHWHKNYESAPTNDSIWILYDDKNNCYRLLRGGSWDSNPRGCRSALRYKSQPDLNHIDFGFRVVYCV